MVTSFGPLLPLEHRATTLPWPSTTGVPSATSLAPHDTSFSVPSVATCTATDVGFEPSRVTMSPSCGEAAILTAEAVPAVSRDQHGQAVDRDRHPRRGGLPVVERRA